jgi:hypothetical protein
LPARFQVANKPCQGQAAACLGSPPQSNISLKGWDHWMAVDSVAPQPAGQDQAWQALIRHRDIQFAFPDSPGIAPMPFWLRRLLDFFHRHADWVDYTGWALLGAGALVLAYFLVRHILRRGWAQAESPPLHPLPAWQPDVDQARLLLRDADALAAQGRFEDAAHLLLLVCIQELGERRPGLVLPALTSREISHLEVLSPQARHIFSHIAMVVERCLFGARALGAEDFSQVRAAFEQFTIPAAGRAAA